MKHEQPTFNQGVLVGIVITALVLASTFYLVSQFGGVAIATTQPAPSAPLVKQPAPVKQAEYLDSLEFYSDLCYIEGHE